MDSLTWVCRNDGGQGCFATISMRETGNKMRSFCCRPCCASAKVMVKCCYILKSRPLPSPLVFDLTQPLFSHWPLTWHLAVNNHDLISIYLFVLGSSWLNFLVIVYTGMISTEPPCNLHMFHWVNSLQNNIRSCYCITLVTLLVIILLSSCCPATTCTSVFDDAFKLSSR